MSVSFYSTSMHPGQEEENLHAKSEDQIELGDLHVSLTSLAGYVEKSKN